MKQIFFIIALVAACSSCSGSGEKNKCGVELTLIPPTTITTQVELDIRAGLTNPTSGDKKCDVKIYLNGEDDAALLHSETTLVEAGGAKCVRYNMDSAGKAGKNRIILVVETGGRKQRLEREIEIVESDIRSTRRIDGAWAGIYHWSETEGKHWNKDIKLLTNDDWRSVVRSMHGIGMDIIVIQEVFRNQEYVGKHESTVENYQGMAFYPSALYPGRMPIAADDPLEAIMSEADKLGMHVMPGVGLFAWFDYTPESLEWHKMVAKELVERYGHHDSFYGFYVSEESGGSLDNWERTEERRSLKKKEMVDFFAAFKVFCNGLAPSKPIMLATNSYYVPAGADTYPALLANLDILCPFGFARMPEDDLTGKEAADMLQKMCDEADSHLWFDLEAFLFNDDISLYPRDIEGITEDLTLLDNFEKILCYQYPGVFSDPDGIRIGEEKTIKLYKDYRDYLKSVTYK